MFDEVDCKRSLRLLPRREEKIENMIYTIRKVKKSELDT